jgi:hypothetical protein
MLWIILCSDKYDSVIWYARVQYAWYPLMQTSTLAIFFFKMKFLHKIKQNLASGFQYNF